MPLYNPSSGGGAPSGAAGGDLAGTYPNPTIGAKKVDIANVVDGVDGELITWDATGEAATVAVGTATHVLTSNGAGAAPTFQAAAGGGSTLYEAVVDAAGGGDYLLPSAAFNDGKTVIFIKNGVYTETVDVDIPNKGVMIGESAGGVIINLSGSVSVKADGNGGTKETAGTISVVHNTTGVTGSGTTFTNLSVGDFILIGTTFMEIDTITDNTDLDLVEQYRGDTASAIEYEAMTMLSGVHIRNLSITGSTVEGLIMRGCRHFSIENILVQLCGGSTTDNIQVYDCGSSRIIGSASTLCTKGDGIEVDDSYSITISNSEFYNNEQNGMNITGNSKNIIVDSCVLNNNNNDAVSIFGGDYINISNCVGSYNNESGIDSSGGVRNVVIDGCNFSNNGTNGVDCDTPKSVVSNCIVDNCAGTGIKAGDECVISGNNVFNNDGIGIDLANDFEATVTGNNVYDNGGDGIKTSGTSNRNIITANRVGDNTGTGINISAVGNTNNLVTNNVVVGNTVAEITDSGTGTVTANNVTT